MNWKRNPITNLIDGFEYKFKEDGRIDWAALIPAEFYYPNKEKLLKKKNGQEIIDSINDKTKTAAEWGLTNDYMLVNLAGFQWIAALRGYSASRFTNLISTTENAAVVSEIDWLPLNQEAYENTPAIYTQGLAIGTITSAVGSANLSNTNDMMQDFLAEAAQNRAFIRNVRVNLDIPHYGVEEINPNSKKNSNAESQLDDKRGTTQRLMDKNGWTFEQVLAWGKQKFGKKISWESLDDISGPHLYELNAAMEAKSK